MVSPLVHNEQPIIISSFDGRELATVWDTEVDLVSTGADISLLDQDCCRSISGKLSFLNSKSEESQSTGVISMSEESYYSDDFLTNSSSSYKNDQSLLDNGNKNSDHKIWLKQLSSQLKEEELKFKVDKDKVTNKRHHFREQLAERVRNRKSINYYSATILSSSNSKGKCQKKENFIISAKEREKKKEAEINRMTYIRMRSKMKYKKYLQLCKEKREVEAKAREDELKRKEILRNKLKTIVLRSFQHDKSSQNENNIIAVTQGNGFQAIRHKKNTDNENDILHKDQRKANIQKLTEKCKTELKEIRRKKLEKETLFEQKTKRLQKRAHILRSKYSQSSSFKTDEESISENINVNHPKDEIFVNNKSALSRVEVDDMVKRLGTYKRQDLNLPESDFVTWKRKRGLKDNQKVFFLSGWYPAIRENLIERGWIFNGDKESLCYDLAWTLHSGELKDGSISSKIKTNHFRNNTCLTTKTGLLHTLRYNASFFVDINFLDFFPRAYDLSLTSDVQLFLCDYRINLVQSELQNLIAVAENYGYQNDSNEPFRSLYVNPGVLEMLLDITRRSYTSCIEDNIESPLVDKTVFSESESEIIMKSKTWLYNPVSFGKGDDFFDCFKIPQSIDSFLCSKPESDMSRKAVRNHDRLIQRKLLERKRIAETLDSTRPLKRTEFSLIRNCLEKANNDSCRQLIDGKRSKNIWIVKPAEKSRGRGIATFRCIEKLLKYVAATDMTQSRWFVQKYIENALLIANRRFDIRQWVLVTCLDPLTIWCQSDCYARFASEEYFVTNSNENDDSWLDNTFRHLVNNSVNKNNSSKFKTQFCAENGINVNDHMWSKDDLVKWLTHNTKNDRIWDAIIFPKIQDMIKQTLLCSQGNMVEREHSWELFGYDFMIDDNYSPWLIEINSSPSCEYSTSTTSKFVPGALKGVLKIVLDNIQNKNQVDGWIKIHEGNKSPKLMSTLGVDLALLCEKIKLPRKDPNHKVNPVRLLGESKTQISHPRQNHTSKDIIQKEILKIKNPPLDLVFDDSDLSDYEPDHLIRTKHEGKENSSVISKLHPNLVKTRYQNVRAEKAKKHRKVLMPISIKTVEWS